MDGADVGSSTSHPRAAVRSDRSLLDLLLRSGGFALLHAGETQPITRVGGDYVESGSIDRTLVRLDLATVVEQPSFPPPSPVASNLVDELAAASASRPIVLIDTLDGRVRGTLEGAGPDHVAVKTWTGRILVSFGTIRSVQLQEQRSAL